MPFLRHGNQLGQTIQMLSFDQGPDKRSTAFWSPSKGTLAACPQAGQPGVAIIQMIEGSFAYRSGQSIYGNADLARDVLQGPERLLQPPIRFVCTIVYPTPGLQD